MFEIGFSNTLWHIGYRKIKTEEGGTKKRMDENFNILCQNLSFPDIPESDFTEQMTPLYMLGVIQILHNTPPVEFKDSFKNRWEEIKKITLANLALNRNK